MATHEVLRTGLDGRLSDLEALYQDLHEHPELSFQEERTATVMARRLAAAGFEVTTGVGKTGVVGVLRNGDGPGVLLRADMDALPVKEIELVGYRSSATGVDPDGVTTPVMHACGHDTHMTALIGAVEQLVAHRDSWSGTVIAVCQPAEELGSGARAMLDDGFIDRFPPFDVALGQHISAGPRGHLFTRPGVFLSAADSLRITIHGRGGHAAKPHAAIDPVVIGASIVLRLQTIVAREVAPNDVAVVTVASFQAGSKENVIPAEAELKVNVRTFDPEVRARVLDAIARIVRHEAAAAGAPREAEIAPINDFPLCVNDVEATKQVMEAFSDTFGGEYVHEIGRESGSEDFGCFAQAAGVPSVFWMFGGFDPESNRANTPATSGRAPGNHSPEFVPTRLQPTLKRAVEALLTAAAIWLQR
jgi:amidohydrolase